MWHNFLVYQTCPSNENKTASYHRWHIRPPILQRCLNVQSSFPSKMLFLDFFLIFPNLKIFKIFLRSKLNLVDETLLSKNIILYEFYRKLATFTDFEKF